MTLGLIEKSDEDKKELYHNKVAYLGNLEEELFETSKWLVS